MESNLDPAFLTIKKPSFQSPEQKRISEKLVQEDKQKTDMVWASFGGIFLNLFVAFFLVIFKYIIISPHWFACLILYLYLKSW